MGLSNEVHELSHTAHPFCTAFYPNDVRLTTHYNEENLLGAFLATMHEGGHGLYEANLPLDYFGTPLAEASSHGIHESQSRIWETCIGHSKPFWNHYYPKLKEIFQTELEGIPVKDFYAYVNFVKPSFIRIFSDEVTYNLHICLRYEIEKGLIEGKLKAKEVPEMWNHLMKELLGITPKTDKEGCLQDIHWSLGLVGYFPSYTLGNLYAGALFQNLKKENPNFHQKVESGEFEFITNYLKTKVHQYGREFSPKELIEKATKEPFTTKPYINYLNQKYLSE
jgi:carboxypeptidase Taq